MTARPYANAVARPYDPLTWMEVHSRRFRKGSQTRLEFERALAAIRLALGETPDQAAATGANIASP